MNPGQTSRLDEWVPSQLNGRIDSIHGDYRVATLATNSISNTRRFVGALRSTLAACMQYFFAHRLRQAGILRGGYARRTAHSEKGVIFAEKREGAPFDGGRSPLWYSVCTAPLPCSRPEGHSRCKRQGEKTNVKRAFVSVTETENKRSKKTERWRGERVRACEREAEHRASGRAAVPTGTCSMHPRRRPQPDLHARSHRRRRCGAAYVLSSGSCRRPPSVVHASRKQSRGETTVNWSQEGKEEREGARKHLEERPAVRCIPTCRTLGEGRRLFAGT